MEISKVNLQSNAVKPSNQKGKNESDEFTNILTEQTGKAGKFNFEKRAHKVIGLTTVISKNSMMGYTVTAAYAEDSTKENPVVQLTTNYGGKKSTYKVTINELNPKNATRMEMFALCSYADAEGLVERSTFGSWSTLTAVQEMAVHNGFIDQQTGTCDGLNDFLTERLDWENMSQKVADLLFECKDMKQYTRTSNVLNLLTMLSEKAELKKTTVPSNHAEQELYDITNMSFDRLCELSKKLLDEEKITLLDHAIITFDPGKSPQKLGFEENYFKSEQFSNGNRNWLEEFRLRYEQDAKLGNKQGFENNRRIHEILSRLV